MTELARWANFYVIVGSAAGGLTGLQFVVMALVADIPMQIGDTETIDAFSTPTIVHFGAVLLLTAILSAPWHRTLPPAALLGVEGLAGLVYTIITARRMRVQDAYQPVFEDWLFHVGLPALAYTVLAGAMLAARQHLARALFAVAFAAMLLLSVGIHNAWDTVTYLVMLKRKTTGVDRP